MKHKKIWDGTVPSSDNGRDFDASIGAEEIQPGGAFLDSLNIGLLGDVSTAAVAIEDFVNELSEYVVEVNGETRIKMDAQDLCALMAAFYGMVPNVQENTDNTGHDFIQGLRVPIQAPHGQNDKITHAATNTGQTNISNTELAIYGKWLDNAGGKRPVIANKVALTTAGSTGWDLRDFRIAAQGDLKGILIRQANPYSDANSDISVQRIALLADGVVHSEFHAIANMSLLARLQYTASTPLTDLLESYLYVPFDEEPIDGVGQELKLQIDVQDASDAVDVIPIVLKK